MFDGERALRDLREIASLGPRPTGSAALESLRRRLSASFETPSFKVTRQSFTFTQPSRPHVVQTGVNLIASWMPNASRRILVGTHCDTRPIADNEPDEERQRQPIIGANDGASGVAFLLELGRWLQAAQLPLGVDIVFFDAEEWVHDPDLDRLVVGSEHFATTWTAGGGRPDYEAAIILDIIAREEAIFSPDVRSWLSAPRLVDEIWSTAEALGLSCFDRRVRWEVLADHVPLLDVGMPAAILIDVDDPRWHTLEDRDEFCSATMLARVGTVFESWLLARTGTP